MLAIRSVQVRRASAERGLSRSGLRRLTGGAAMVALVGRHAGCALRSALHWPGPVSRRLVSGRAHGACQSLSLATAWAHCVPVCTVLMSISRVVAPAHG